jgi:hypothetical protein
LIANLAWHNPNLDNKQVHTIHSWRVNRVRVVKEMVN